MLNVVCCYAVCQYSEFRYAEGRGATEKGKKTSNNIFWGRWSLTSKT